MRSRRTLSLESWPKFVPDDKGLFRVVFWAGLICFHPWGSYLGERHETSKSGRFGDIFHTFITTYLPQEATAEVSKDKEPIGRRCGIQLIRKAIDSCNIFDLSIFSRNWCVINAWLLVPSPSPCPHPSHRPTQPAQLNPRNSTRATHAWQVGRPVPPPSTQRALQPNSFLLSFCLSFFPECVAGFPFHLGGLGGRPCLPQVG